MWRGTYAQSSAQATRKRNTDQVWNEEEDVSNISFGLLLRLSVRLWGSHEESRWVVGSKVVRGGCRNKGAVAGKEG